VGAGESFVIHLAPSSPLPLHLPYFNASMKFNTNLPIVTAVWAVVAQTTSAACPNLKASYQAPVLSDGWEATLIANDLKAPRGIIFDSHGGLLVIDNGFGIVQYKFTDGGSGCLDVDKKTILVNATDVSFSAAFKEHVLIRAVESRYHAVERWQNPVCINLGCSLRVGVRRLETFGQQYEPNYSHRNE
jgi:hypothetical protein